MKRRVCTRWGSAALTTALAAWSLTAFAGKDPIQLARPFGDHMVLQRGMKLPVWGTARPGQEVIVRLGESIGRTKSEAGGAWRIDLPPLPASATPATMTVEAGREKVTVDDILVGEVWLAAGQSNMDFFVKQSKTGRQALEKADNASLRLLNFRRAGWRRWSAGKQPLSKEEAMAEFSTERYFSGSWETCNRESAADFAAVAYFFGSEIQQNLAVPVGVINVAVGGTPCEAWTRRQALAEHPQLKVLVQGNWLDNKMIQPWSRGWARKMIDGAPEKVSEDELGPNHCCKPGFCWEAGVRPLVPFAIRGVIWYQGESNSEPLQAQLYPALFPTMVGDWRRQWGQPPPLSSGAPGGDFPFLYVQLAAHKAAWAPIRQMQLKFLDQVPATGMAVTMDIGSRDNIHPSDKEPVGHRLALWALGTVYGKDLVYSGPLFKDRERKEGSLVVRFRFTGSGLITRDGKDPVGFEVAGEDGAFVASAARIVEDTVVVAAEKVPAPVHVRYGWAGFPDPPINLCNREGLPASPFTTIESPLRPADDKAAKPGTR